MSGETIAQLEEIADSLQHTRTCETEALYFQKPCICGVEDICSGIRKYRLACWKELRSD